MRRDAVIGIVINLLLILHSSKAHKAVDDSLQSSLVVFLGAGQHSVLSLFLLAMTVVLSVIIYLWVLRYICVGCCQPIAVGIDPESLAEMSSALV